MALAGVIYSPKGAKMVSLDYDSFVGGSRLLTVESKGRVDRLNDQIAQPNGVKRNDI